MLGSKYIYKNPSAHAGFDCITLDAWANGKGPDSFIHELRTQGKAINGHSILDKRRKPKAQTLDELLDYVREKLAIPYALESWDILNEALGSWPDDWLLSVLAEARKSQPESLLFWNEYALKNRQYWNRLIDLAAIAKAKGVLDGVGIQRHIDLRGKLPYTSVTKSAHAVECHLKSWVGERRLRHEIQRIHDLGLLCHISEVSITCFPWQESNAQAFLDRLVKVAEDNKVWRLTYWSYPVIRVVEGN